MRIGRSLLVTLILAAAAAGACKRGDPPIIAERDACGACVVANDGAHISLMMSGQDRAQAASATLEVTCESTTHPVSLPGPFVAGSGYLVHTGLTCKEPVTSVKLTWSRCEPSSGGFGCGIVSEPTVAKPLSTTARKDDKSNKDPCGACTLDLSSNEITMSGTPSGLYGYRRPMVAFVDTAGAYYEVEAEVDGSHDTVVMDGSATSILFVRPAELGDDASIRMVGLRWKQYSCDETGANCRNETTDMEILHLMEPIGQATSESP